jgi:hypothetical protein
MSQQDSGAGATQAAEATGKISNPRDIQGILALLVTAGLLAVVVFAMTKAGSLSDAISVVNVLAPLAAMVLGYYFGSKSAAAQGA